LAAGDASPLGYLAAENEWGIPFEPETLARKIGLADASGYGLRGFACDVHSSLDPLATPLLTGVSAHLSGYPAEVAILRPKARQRRGDDTESDDPERSIWQCPALLVKSSCIFQKKWKYFQVGHGCDSDSPGMGCWLDPREGFFVRAGLTFSRLIGREKLIFPDLSPR
jgi:hypothetical protein